MIWAQFTWSLPQIFICPSYPVPLFHQEVYFVICLGRYCKCSLFVLVFFWTAIEFCLKYFREVTSTDKPDTVNHFGNVHVGVFDKVLGLDDSHISNVVRNGCAMHQFEAFLQFGRGQASFFA